MRKTWENMRKCWYIGLKVKKVWESALRVQKVC